MIFILPQQEGSPHTNCLSVEGMDACHKIADFFKHHNNLYIYTSRPNYTGEDITSIQTASMIGSLLKQPINIIKSLKEYPPNYDTFIHLIIWNKNEIPEILSSYFHNHFNWDESTHRGAVIINEKGWTFQENYIPI